ncbi:phytanoyl-CoA dioxygenase family protein [Argonema galeatum]|uniref:phytanoyl-CoA dioxygenase family protein n=1 Tax=Argonema galeatum TaxID=2942762 RepID=UPI0020118DE1|nr:phytanoyl-CoA dioxygenase family protein [Argonema galeatum]
MFIILKILDLVEDLIGTDILCWESALFVKPSQSDAYISWHQDLTYWGLDDSDILTVWVALTPSIKESGCVRVIPGSHLGKVVPHKDTFAPKNMLTRGKLLPLILMKQKPLILSYNLVKFRSIMLNFFIVLVRIIVSIDELV